MTTTERFSEVIGGGDGLKVRLVTRRGSPFLHLEIDYRKDGTWRNRRESLQHADLPRARAYAYQLLGSMLEKRPEMAAPVQRGRPTAAQRKPETVGGPITLGRVVDLYQQSAAFGAAEPETQQDRRTAFAILLDFVDPTSHRAWRDLPAAELDPEKVQALVNAWGAGTYDHPKLRWKKARPGRIKNALAYLRTACRWAHGVRTGKGRLLPESVFDGVRLPVERNPVQVRMPAGTFDQLLTVAARPTTRWPEESRRQFSLLLLCADAWGNRVHALLNLRVQDIRFTEEEVWWSPENDKMCQGRTQHLPADLAAVLRTELRRTGRPVTPWLFYSPDDPTYPTPYPTALKWLNAAFRHLGVEKPKGLGYHSLRRKWRSDRDGQPLKAVMEEGGWKSTEAAMRYAKPNKEERKAVALAGRPGHVRITPLSGKSPDKSPDTQVINSLRSLKSLS